MTVRTPLFIGLIFSSASSYATALTFEEALLKARSSRDIIHSAQHKIKKSEAEAAAFGAIPPLTLGVGASTPTEFGPTDQDLSLSQGLDLFGRRADLRRLGLAKVESARSELRAALLQVQGETARAYIAASAAQKALQATSEIRGIAEDLLQAAQRKVQEGRAPEVQALRAKLEVERARLSEASRRSEAQQALTRLAALTGIEGTGEVSSDFNLEVQGTVEERPDLQALKAQIKAAKAEESAVRSQARPEAALSLHRSPWGEDSRFGLRLQVTWNLLDGGRAKHETQAAAQERMSLERAFQDRVKQAKAEALLLEDQIATARRSLTILTSLENDLRTLADKTKRGFEEGVGTLVEVLEAVRSLKEADLERSDAERSIRLLQVDLLDVKGCLLEAMK